MEKFINPLKHYGQKADFWSIFCLQENHEEVSFRQSVQEPISISRDAGALITVMKNGGIGYCSSQDLSKNGLEHAFDIALHKFPPSS